MWEVNALRDELNEVNLLNAKLLYVNKIFRSRNLTESQKSKVLAAFDKAGSVNEVKLVFETITESVTAKKEVVKESLGRASKAAGVAPTRQPIVEVDSQVARWQKLAGIK
jgi:3-hydroxyacyl-CoA dehydrogenase